MVEIRKIEEVWGGVDIPEITGVYDPLSGLRDGTITSQAPIVVSGYNLNRYALENMPGDTSQTGTGDRYQACVYVL